MEKKDKTSIPLEDLLVDCRELGSFLIDLPSGARAGLMSEQEGCDLAIAEVMDNHSTLGDKAGVTDSDIQTLIENNRRIELIDQYLPRLRKIIEVMEETRAKSDDQRQRVLSAVGLAVESRAKVYDSDELLGRYEKVREYRSSIAAKGWRTRRRSQAQAARNRAPKTVTAESPSKA